MSTGTPDTIQTRRTPKGKAGMASVSKALFSVVRIEAYSNEVGITQNALLSKATGFLYENSENDLFVVTNKHVVYDPREDYYPDFLVVYVRYKPGAWSKTESLKLELYANKKARWKTPADKKADIAVLSIAYKDLPGNIVAVPLSIGDALPKSCHPTLGSQAMVLGFPKGAFYDPSSNFPVCRIATVATLPWLTFKKRNCFLIDARLHEGMSGSPIISMPRSIYEKDHKPVYNDVRCYLLGIFSSEWLWGSEPLGLNTVWPTDLIEEATK